MLEKEISTSDNSAIRLFTVARQASEEPKQNCYGNWLECSPETVENFSAVAYYYGRELNKELKVPIGLINASWGGTPAEAWTRKEILESDNDLKVYLQRYEETYKEFETRYLPDGSVCPLGFIQWNDSVHLFHSPSVVSSGTRVKQMFMNLDCMRYYSRQ